MSVLRQALAMAVLFLAFDALVEKRLLRFCILVVLAAQFHAVSYVFLFAYPMLWWIKEPREGQLKKNWIYEKIMVAGAIGIALLAGVKTIARTFPEISILYFGGVHGWSSESCNYIENYYFGTNVNRSVMGKWNWE